MAERTALPRCEFVFDTGNRCQKDAGHADGHLWKVTKDRGVAAVSPSPERAVVIELFDEVGCGLAALEMHAEEGHVVPLHCRTLLRKVTKLREMLVPNAPEEPMMKDHFPDRGVAAVSPSEPRPIDGKFGFVGDKIVNLVSGQEIPPDEPLFLLRARDHHALAAIHAYQGECEADCNELHMAGIQQVREKFCQFAADHPERMKQPGITRHLKLAAAPAVPPEPTPVGPIVGFVPEPTPAGARVNTEMLNALKLVFAQMQEQYVPDDCQTDAGNCEWCTTYRAVESAIAHAEIGDGA